MQRKPTVSSAHAARRLKWLVPSTLFALLVAACMGGDPSADRGDRAKPDAAHATHDAALHDAASHDAASHDAAGHHDAGKPIDADTEPCVNATTNYGSGQHNAGMDCTMCHTPSGSGPPFTVAGTMYTTSAGTTPAAGAAITVIDKSGAKTNLVVQANGNFYTNTSFTFPLTVYASSCPTVDKMPSTVSAETGSQVGCSESGCHGSLVIHLQ
jgi:hypothetical protein